MTERGMIVKSLIMVFSASIALVAVVVRHRPQFEQKERMFSVEELSLYKGSDESLPILLGVVGSVFDVTKGRSHYGVGGGYHHFAGRDASRAFVCGKFTGDGLMGHCKAYPALSTDVPCYRNPVSELCRAIIRAPLKLSDKLSFQVEIASDVALLPQNYRSKVW